MMETGRRLNFKQGWLAGLLRYSRAFELRVELEQFSTEEKSLQKP